MTKRLFRLKNDKVLFGVCSGIATYFGIDPVIVRLLWVLFAFCGGAGVLAYIVAAIIMPLEV
jgi:phage shock protein C